MSKESIEKTLKSLDETVIQNMNENHLPGMAVGVVHDGELIYAKGFGLANIEKNVPVTADTIFRIGSISKTFTAVGIMTLYEQGKLDLDDPVNEHLKAYKVVHKDPNAPPVTIRHMLTHTSGVGELRSLLDVFKPVIGLGAKLEEPEISLAEYYNGVLTTELHPGHKWAYGNHAFATLGQIITDVSGMPYEQYMIEHVFEPLGMHRSDYLLSSRVADGLAQGYEWKKGRFKPIPYTRIIIGAAGSIHSSVNEMANYVTALMNGGANQNGRVLKPETLEQMFTSQLDTDPRVFQQGLAFIILHYGKHRIAFHNGGWPGFISSMLVAPDDKLAVVAFTNSNSPAPDLLTAKVMHQLLNEPEPHTLLPRPGVLETPHEWSKMCGFYGPTPGLLTNARIWLRMGGEVEVFVKDNHLAIRSLMGEMAKGVTLQRGDPNDPYFYQGAANFYQGAVNKDVISMVFKRGSNGEINALEIGSSIFYKRPYQQSLKFRLLAIGGSLAGLLAFLLGRKVCRKKKK